MTTPEETIEAKLKEIDGIVLDGEIDSMESRYQLGEKIRGVVYDARAAERASWQERERVLREAIKDAAIFAVREQNWNLAVTLRNALNQTAKENE